eukprot:TRINITY_DN131_c1_g1_i2.p1 TRINITY_DN131_c1_g1~~TRINITY_DN131_c1_g1_i2.p1  ORF type:complete len:205 (+),score=35.26 TRINITY_DN131_c1_g1_i2:151-765(+)
MHGATGHAAPVMYELQFRGVKLDNKDFLSKSDPFLLLKASTAPGLNTGGGAHGTKQSNPFKTKKTKTKDKSAKKAKKMSGKAHGGGWVVVHKTEWVKDNLNPTWRPFTIDINTLAHGNLEQPFMVEVWDWDDSGHHDLIGSNRTTLRELQTLREVRLDNPARVGFSSTAGRVEVLKCGPVSGGGGAHGAGAGAGAVHGSSGGHH